MAELVFDRACFDVVGKGRVEVSGRVRDGERVVIVGPSGCGKTTLLRAVAGLHSLESGSISYDGRELSSLAPEDIRAGLLFQGGALFAHLSVVDNVAFGLRYLPKTKAWTQDLRRNRALEMMEKVGLGSLKDRSVENLSGGERQRVALIRTLICEPPLLLLDEPLSAVDSERRQSLQVWILDLISKNPVPTLLVTHDEIEAKTMGTRVVKWKEGDTCLNLG